MGGYLTNPTNKKGFTLIELLAVIVILAVIALIATPLIMNVINDTKKNAFKETFNNVLKAVELANAKEEFKDYTYNITKGVFSYANGVEGTPSVGIKGDLSKVDGVAYTTKEGYSAGYIDDGTYCAYKLVTDKTATILKSGECKDKILASDSTGGGLVCPPKEECPSCKTYEQLKEENKLYLYKEGNEYIETTGGFIQGFKYDNGAIQNQIVKNSDHLFIQSYWPNASDSGYRSFIIKNIINLTGYSRLYVRLSSTEQYANSGASWISINNENYVITQNPLTTNNILRPSYARISHTTNYIAIDISNINEEVYISLVSTATNGSGTTKIYEMFLEK